MKTLICIFFLNLSIHAYGINHSSFTQVLKKYADSYGFFNYKGLASDVSLKKTFDTYLNLLKGVHQKSYNSMNLSAKKSFLINAYNAFTIKLILDYYSENKNKLPTSIKKTVGWLRSPWKKEFFSLLGGKITYLDQIEHEYLREKSKKIKDKTFHDYRVHAALNCASRSCPRLRNEAYSDSKSTLNAQLNEQMRLWIQDQDGIDCKKTSPRNIVSKKTIEISKIFDWFDKDFTVTPEGQKTNIKEVLLLYSSSAQKSFVQAKKPSDLDDYLDYDWDLNQACSP